MPFGLDLKSLVVGLLLGWFGIKYLMALVAGRRTAANEA